MDLSKIIHASGLRFEFVAQNLFPANKYPYNALLRVINTKAELSESQLIALADLLKVTPNDLLSYSEKWVGAQDAGALELRKGDYSVIYNAALGTYTLHRSEALTTQYLGTYTVPLGITVRDFLKTVDARIKELT